MINLENAEKLISASEVAKLLCVSVSTVTRLRERGDLQGIRIGYRHKFRLSVVLAYLTKDEQQRSA